MYLCGARLKSMKKGAEKKSVEVSVTRLCLMILICLFERVVKGKEWMLLKLTPRLHFYARQ